MSELFRGFEQLLELAKALEDKLDSGELKTDIQINARPLSSIPRQGVPRSSNPPASNIGTSRMRPPASPQPASHQPASQPPAASASDDAPTGPTASLRDLGGLSSVLQELRELVEIPLKRPELLTKLGLEPAKGVLLVGPPGTGKTLTARALAEDLGVNYIAIVGPEVMGKYYGEAEARLREIFERAARSAPCLVFSDSADAGTRALR